jgi:hypothetical protein
MTSFSTPDARRRSPPTCPFAALAMANVTVRSRRVRHRQDEDLQMLAGELSTPCAGVRPDVSDVTGISQPRPGEAVSRAAQLG